jgi:purine-nucleoside phosphorylase
MIEHFALDKIDGIVRILQERTSRRPRVGIILGSGLNGLAESVESPSSIPFGDLPLFPVSTVFGHAGRIVIGELERQPVFVMQGRIHYYEGYSMAQVTLPVRVMQRAGIDTLIVTNAAGGVNPAFEAGDVMLISDHLNLLGTWGTT